MTDGRQNMALYVLWFTLLQGYTAPHLAHHISMFHSSSGVYSATPCAPYLSVSLKFRGTQRHTLRTISQCFTQVQGYTAPHLAHHISVFHSSSGVHSATPCTPYLSVSLKFRGIQRHILRTISQCFTQVQGYTAPHLAHHISVFHWSSGVNSATPCTPYLSVSLKFRGIQWHTNFTVFSWPILNNRKRLKEQNDLNVDEGIMIDVIFKKLDVD